MDKEEIRNYLKENLEMKVDVGYDCDSVEVILLLEGEEIVKGSDSVINHRSTWLPR